MKKVIEPQLSDPYWKACIVTLGWLANKDMTMESSIKHESVVKKGWLLQEGVAMGVHIGANVMALVNGSLCSGGHAVGVA